MSDDDDDDFEFPEEPPLGFEMVAEKFLDAMEPHADKLGEGTREMIAKVRAGLREMEELDRRAHALRQELARLRGERRAPSN